MNKTDFMKKWGLRLELTIENIQHLLMLYSDIENQIDDYVNKEFKLIDGDLRSYKTSNWNIIWLTNLITELYHFDPRFASIKNLTTIEFIEFLLDLESCWTFEFITYN